MSDEQIPEILSIKTLDGEVFAGDFVETKKLYGRDVHVLDVNGLRRYVPVNQCAWWSLGDKSATEVQFEIRQQMKEEAAAVLEEHLNGSQEQEVEEQQPTQYSDEEVANLHAKVTDRGNISIQEALQRIATHQRKIPEQQAPDTRIIQPGEEEMQQERVQSPQVRTSIARLPDDTPEV